MSHDDAALARCTEVDTLVTAPQARDQAERRQPGHVLLGERYHPDAQYRSDALERFAWQRGQRVLERWLQGADEFVSFRKPRLDSLAYRSRKRDERPHVMKRFEPQGRFGYHPPGKVPSAALQRGTSLRHADRLEEL